VPHEPLAPEQLSASKTAPAPRASAFLRRRPVGFVALVVVLLVVGGFGLLTFMTRTPGAVPAAQPATGCSPVPVDYRGGPLLYWASTALQQGNAKGIATRHEGIPLVCGIGFRPGEHVTLRLENAPTQANEANAPAPVTVTANADGSFATDYAVGVAALCSTEVTSSRLVQATGDLGSQATVKLLRSPEVECAAP